MANPIIIGGRLAASGTGAVGIYCSGDTTIAHVDSITATTSISVVGGATASVIGNQFDPTATAGAGTIEYEYGDRSAWDVVNYPLRHASDIYDESFDYHNDPDNPPLSSYLGSGSFFVGNGSNVAIGVTMSGDATLNNAGVITIAPLAIDGSNIAITNGSIYIGGVDGAAHEQSIHGDAALSNDGTLTLSTVNADVGTYGDETHLAQITVDEKGRITAIGEIEFDQPVVPISVYNEVQIADGTSTIYYLTNYAAPGTIRVYVNGVRQPATDDTAATDEVTFTSAPIADAVLMFDYEMDQT